MGAWIEQTASPSGSWSAVATSADGFLLAGIINGQNISTSADAGVTWQGRTASGARAWTDIASSADGQRLAATVSGGYIYTSADAGATWTERTAAGSRYWSGITTSSDGQRLAATATGPGYVYTSTDGGATWTQRGSSNSWSGIAGSADGLRLHAIVSSDMSMYTSADGGATWTGRNSGLNLQQFRQFTDIACSADGTKAIMSLGDSNTGVYLSTNSGSSWRQIGSGAWQSVGMSADGKTLAASGNGTGIIRSTDGGTTIARRDIIASYYLTGHIGINADGSRMAAGLGAGSSGHVWTCYDPPYAPQTWKNMYFGSTQVQALYLGSRQIWAKP
jgi:hypothetical protein